MTPPSQTQTWARSVPLIVALVAAAGFAAFRKQQSGEVRMTDEVPRAVELHRPSMDEQIPNDEQLPPGHPPIGGLGTGSPGEALPPGHPPIAAGATSEVRDDDELAPEIRWSVPGTWRVAPNASAMRLATYRVPAAGGVEEAELTVVRAGGSTEANLKRWVEQFENPANEKRATRSVHGLAISTIEVQGDFKKGMMGTDTAATRKGWMLLGAIVQIKESSYFFKMTGPAPAVRGARADFEGLLESVVPSSGGATKPAAK